MASLKKRGNYWSIVFKKHINGKQVIKTYSLGVKYGKIARHKLTEYEKLYQRGEIDPFDDNWNLKEYEEKKNGHSTQKIDSYYLDDLRKKFLKYKSHTAKPTRDHYNSVLKLFTEHVGRSMTINLIRPHDIRTFCFQERFSTATQRNYLRHLKSFFNWAVDNEIIKNNPCSDIKAPKKKNKLVDKVITESQLKSLIHIFRNYQFEQKKAGHIKDFTQMQFWFKPLITTAFYTGLRRKELLQLRWEQLNLKKREIHVTNTKSGGERTVILFDPVYNRLKAWKKFQDNSKNGLVFPSPRSTDKLEIQLTGRTVSNTFKFFVKKAKLKDTIHFHGLRHSCATFMLKQGFDVVEVKEMLGHKSIEVTSRYVHLVSNDRKRKAEKLGLIS